MSELGLQSPSMCVLHPGNRVRQSEAVFRKGRFPAHVSHQYHQEMHREAWRQRAFSSGLHRQCAYVRLQGDRLCQNKYQMQGLIQQQGDAEPIRSAPLVPLLSIFESNRSFIISFTSDNPVRQIMADIVAPAQGVVESETASLKDKEKSPKQFPQVVPCAGRSIFNKASSDIYAGDPTSLRVAKWFEMYEVVEAGFNDDQKKVYGDISLHKYEISAVHYAPSSTAEPPAAGGDTTMGGYLSAARTSVSS